MTPEEKAKHLIQHYQSILSNFKQSNARRQKNYAKLCSNICVDEIIQELEPDDLFKNYNERVTYWRDVKEEISKL